LIDVNKFKVENRFEKSECKNLQKGCVSARGQFGMGGVLEKRHFDLDEFRGRQTNRQSVKLLF
jgi:hypothetical protein